MRTIIVTALAVFLLTACRSVVFEQDSIHITVSPEVAGLALAQLLIAAGMVSMSLPDWMRATHVTLGAAVFAALVWLAWIVARPAEGVATQG